MPTARNDSNQLLKFSFDGLNVAGSDDMPAAYGRFVFQLSAEQPGSPSLMKVAL